MDDRVIRKVEQDKAIKRLVEAEVEYRAGIIDTNYRVSRGMLIAGCRWRLN